VRSALLQRLRTAPETLVLFEAPGRVGATLAALHEALGERPACVARELTKLHEELVRGPLSALAMRFAAAPPRGEVTLVVGGRTAEAARADAAGDEEALDALIRERVAAGYSPRDVAAELSGKGRMRRREAYTRALRARGGS
jgi:16S rRNA (cytidine1402-2'-O)-methyltransferase